MTDSPSLELARRLLLWRRGSPRKLHPGSQQVSNSKDIRIPSKFTLHDCWQEQSTLPTQTPHPRKCVGQDSSQLILQTGSIQHRTHILFNPAAQRPIFRKLSEITIKHTEIFLLHLWMPPGKDAAQGRHLLVFFRLSMLRQKAKHRIKLLGQQSPIRLG